MYVCLAHLANSCSALWYTVVWHKIVWFYVHKIVWFYVHKIVWFYVHHLPATVEQSPCPQTTITPHTPGPSSSHPTPVMIRMILTLLCFELSMHVLSTSNLNDSISLTAFPHSLDALLQAVRKQVDDIHVFMRQEKLYNRVNRMTDT